MWDPRAFDRVMLAVFPPAIAATAVLWWRVFHGGHGDLVDLTALVLCVFAATATFVPFLAAVFPWVRWQIEGDEGEAIRRARIAAAEERKGKEDRWWT